MQYARAGRRLYEISGAIGDYAESYGYGVVYDLVGHGIGTHLHEEPEIPNFRQWRRGLKLKAGMTLAVEPMINAGSPDVEWMDDEWTVVTYDGSLSAHYENTILITEGRPEILTLTEEETNNLNADKHSPASSAQSTKRRVRGMLLSVGVESSH